MMNDTEFAQKMREYCKEVSWVQGKEPEPDNERVYEHYKKLIANVRANMGKPVITSVREC